MAGTATTEMILRLLLAGRGNPSNTTVVVGHSFGGLILESALAQAFVGALSAAVAQDLHEVRFPADLVLLINPASQAMEAKQLVDIFERNHIKFQRRTLTDETYEVPLVVSMTSTADLATRVLFPVGMRLKVFGNSFRPYGAESCARGRQARVLPPHRGPRAVPAQSPGRGHADRRRDRSAAARRHGTHDGKARLHLRPGDPAADLERRRPEAALQHPSEPAVVERHSLLGDGGAAVDHPRSLDGSSAGRRSSSPAC